MGAVDHRLMGLTRQVGGVVAQQDVERLVIAALDNQVGDAGGDAWPARERAQVLFALGAGDLELVVQGQGARLGQQGLGDGDGVVGEITDQGRRGATSRGHTFRQFSANSLLHFPSQLTEDVVEQGHLGRAMAQVPIVEEQVGDFTQQFAAPRAGRLGRQLHQIEKLAGSVHD
jgi:hypothetical protein